MMNGMGPDCSAPASGPGNIFWLASYPKSGNTWVRAVLKELLPAPVGIAVGPAGLVVTDGIASSREHFDQITGIPAALLPEATVERLRPRVYETWSQGARRPLFVKAHDAWTLTGAGEPLFPLAASRGVVHVVRNPLDVAVSQAHFFGFSMARSVALLNNPERCLINNGGRGLARQLQQRLLDWSGHALSWLDCPLPRLTLRYEDMLADPRMAFGRLCAFAGLAVDGDTLDRAITATRFERLQATERESGFREKTRQSECFFRRGEAGAWRDELEAELAVAIVARHGPVMARLGYAGP